MNSWTPNLVVLKPKNFIKPTNRYQNYVDNMYYKYKRRRDNYIFVDRNRSNTSTSFILNSELVYKEGSLQLIR